VRQADAVIGDELVDVPIAIAFRLAVADKNEQLGVSVREREACLWTMLTRGFPMVARALFGPSRRAQWNGEESRLGVDNKSSVV
jgi:hypothetical protein